MKKYFVSKKLAKIFFILFFCSPCSFQPLYSQNAFYDALVISKYDEKIIKRKLDFIDSSIYDLSASQKKEIETIKLFIEKPFNSNEKINTKVLNDLEIAVNKVIENENLRIRKSEFSSDYKTISKKNSDGSMTVESLAKTDLSVGSLVSNLSGATFQSRLIDATAQLISEKLQEDLSALFLDKFKKRVDRDVLRAFFPKTRDLLFSINPLKNLPSFVILKNTVSEDLKMQ